MLEVFLVNLIVDGSNLFFRAFHTNKKRDSKGRVIGGILSTVELLNKAIRHFSANSVIICFDEGGCSKRKNLYPAYKAKRKSKLTDEDRRSIEFQLQRIFKIMSDLPVHFIKIPNVEGDDLISLFSKTLTKGKNVILSNDRDFLQCVNKNTSLFFPNDASLVTKGNIDEFLGYSQKYFLLWKCIKGDDSDEIKGISGFGEVRTTQKILEVELSGSMESIPKDWKPVLGRNLKLMKMGMLLDQETIDEAFSQLENSFCDQINKHKLSNHLLSVTGNMYGFERYFRNFYGLRRVEL